MAKSIRVCPCQLPKFIDIYIYDTDKFLRASFSAGWCLLSEREARQLRGKEAALVRDLLAQHTEEQTHYQVEDIDKETKFI